MRRGRAMTILGALVGLLAAASLAVAPTVAGARPKPLPSKPGLKLLPHRSCKDLLTVADFPGAATEGPGPPGFFNAGSGAAVSICGYYPAEAKPTEAEPEPPAPTGGGEDALAVYSRASYAPAGKPENLIAPLVGRIDRDENSVMLLHGVGTHAYLVIDKEGDATGLMQVRNDIFEVVKEGAAGVPALLRKAADGLAPGGH
jgi:hypothetical protein